MLLLASPLRMRELSHIATVAKDQQHPQDPWSLMLVTAPDDLQSKVLGAANLFMASYGSLEETGSSTSSKLRISTVIMKFTFFEARGRDIEKLRNSTCLAILTNQILNVLAVYDCFLFILLRAWLIRLMKLGDKFVKGHIRWSRAWCSSSCGSSLADAAHY